MLWGELGLGIYSLSEEIRHKPEALTHMNTQDVHRLLHTCMEVWLLKCTCVSVCVSH